MAGWIDFKTVRTLYTMENLLSKYNVSTRRVGNGLRGNCPLPTHSSDTKGTFSVDPVKNVWTCMSDSCRLASGRNGGNVLDFVAVMEKYSLPDAARLLMEWYGEKNGAPSHGETRRESTGDSPSSHTNGNSPRYMQQVDEWFDKVIVREAGEADGAYWKRIRNAVKGRLIESFRNGKEALKTPCPVCGNPREVRAECPQHE